MKFDPFTTGEAVARMRKEKNKTPDQIAREVSLPDETYRKFEEGWFIVDLNTFFRIASAVGCTSVQEASSLLYISGEG